ncbi:MAG: 4Fe-4S binding protein, partial [Spirochaetota bacterium]
DAANLHLMLHPEETECRPFVSGTVSTVDASPCTGCGACAAACRFGAIGLIADADGARSLDRHAVVDPIACEGCGVCAYVCPTDAVTLVEQHRGTWCVSPSDLGPLVHARLEPGEENSGKLVEQVRREAVESARRTGADWILIDGPPGSGCAAKSAMTGVDFLVLVTEPTVSGVRDMRRVVGLAGHFGIPVGVVINKSDLSPTQGQRIEATIEQRGIIRLGSIPFSAAVPEALTRLVPYPNEHDDAITDELRSIRDAICRSLH